MVRIHPHKPEENRFFRLKSLILTELKQRF